MSENAGLSQKMLFLDGYLLIVLHRGRGANKGATDEKRGIL